MKQNRRPSEISDTAGETNQPRRNWLEKAIHPESRSSQLVIFGSGLATIAALFVSLLLLLPRNQIAVVEGELTPAGDTVEELERVLRNVIQNEEAALVRLSLTAQPDDVEDLKGWVEDPFPDSLNTGVLIVPLSCPPGSSFESPTCEQVSLETVNESGERFPGWERVHGVYGLRGTFAVSGGHLHMGTWSYTLRPVAAEDVP